jgi:hypothetical protein
MNYRDLYNDPVIGEITQGSIFNGAVSEFYPNNPNVFGIVISPRCDIEQKKAPIYYYLPIVRLDDWLQVDFPSIYIPRLTAEVKFFLQNQLDNIGESKSILDKFKAVEVEKALRKHFTKMKDNVEQRIEIWKALEEYKKECNINVVMDKDTTRVRKNVLDEIVTHKNPNFYFLENEDENGFVIRMREISRLTPKVLFSLANGIDDMLPDEELKVNDLRQLDEKDIYMPLYELKSPFIEHVMQHFLQQFNRIGIEDIDKMFVTEAMNLINKKK